MKKRIQCADTTSVVALPHQCGALNEGVQQVLDNISYLVQDRDGFDPQLKMISYEPQGGDETEYSYSIKYEDKDGNVCNAWVAFRSPDEDGTNWTWDGNIYDRNDEMYMMYEDYCRCAGI